MQKDLFGTATLSALPNQYQEKTDFLNKYKITLKLDQAIVAVISLLIIYVFVFSFGVESGKRYAMAEIRSERAKRERMAQELGEKIFANNGAVQTATVSSRIDHSEAAVSSVAQPAVSTQAVSTEASAPKAPAVTASGKFSIQIITFTAKSAAEQMIKKLASNGYQGMIIPSGKFLQVCVTGYETRESANLALTQLKAKGLAPKDAYIRTRS